MHINSFFSFRINLSWRIAAEGLSLVCLNKQIKVQTSVGVFWSAEYVYPVTSCLLENYCNRKLDSALADVFVIMVSANRWRLRYNPIFCCRFLRNRFWIVCVAVLLSWSAGKTSVSLTPSEVVTFDNQCGSQFFLKPHNYDIRKCARINFQTVKFRRQAVQSREK